MANQDNNRIVWIHGISRIKAGYSDPWRNAFNAYLNFQPGAFIETLWCNVFSPRTLFEAAVDVPTSGPSSIALTPRELADAQDLLSSLTTTLQARQSAQEKTFIGEWSGRASQVIGSMSTIAGGMAGGAGGIASSAPGIIGNMGRGSQPDGAATTATKLPAPDAVLMTPQDTVGEFVEYLVSRRIRTAVKEKLKQNLRPLVASGTINSIIAHSWGTVVAYETLLDLEVELPNFRLQHLFTLGSPLWLVQLLLDDRTGRKPANTTNWINIHAQGDPVGSWLKPAFNIDGDFGVSNFGNTVNPHSSYFLSNNMEVQQKIVAKTVLGR